MHRTLPLLVLATVCWAVWPRAAGAQTGDAAPATRTAAYVAAFESVYPRVRSLAEGRALVTPERYDALMLDARLPRLLGLAPADDPMRTWNEAYDYLDLAQDHLNNDRAAMAWGLSYDHLSLNQMARATGDTKYLAASWLTARAIVGARDNVRGIALYTGEVAPVWGCEKYVEAGHAAHLVHTGVITFPVLELLLLLQEAPDFEGKPDAAAQAAVREAMETALAYHDGQWREGPAAGEGYYVGAHQEPAFIGVVLPANRQAAMGRSLWLAWQLTGKADYREKALAIGTYLKNRLSRATDKDAYIWPYSFPLESTVAAAPWRELIEEGVRGEDISHGSLTASFPMLLHRAGELFTEEDAARFANTVSEVVAREGDGVLYTHVDGRPRDRINPGLLVLPSRWLRIAPTDPAVYAALEECLLTRHEALRPLDLANLIRYRPTTGQEPAE